LFRTSGQMRRVVVQSAIAIKGVRGDHPSTT
jgi:hypothetical protein